MKTAMDVGTNRTGMAASPIDGPEAIRSAAEGTPTREGDASGLDRVRQAYARLGEPIGSVPLPTTLKGAAKTTVSALKGEKAAVFLDKLGERLAFERSGVRLYGLLISKLPVSPGWEGAPTEADLLEFQQEELRHFGLVQRALGGLGAGTSHRDHPLAALAATFSMGVLQALSDPRTDLIQGLQGILVAELTDNACWEVLVTLARGLGQDALATQFDEALETEGEHLARVTDWVSTGLSSALQFRGPASGLPAENPGAQG